MKLFNKKLLMASVAICATGLNGFSAPVQAQMNNSSRLVLEEVIVTATKRSTDLQSTPIAITAMSADDIQRAGIQDLRGLSMTTPGLTITGDNQLGTSPVAIRGIGAAGGGIGSDNPVGIYLDDVFLGRPAASTFDLVDIERVEVIRGPQGTLFGRNATGGAVRFVTVRPSLDELQVRTDVQFGNYDTSRFRGMVTAPVSEHVAVKFAGSYSDSNGYGKNLFNGSSTVINEAPDKLFGEEGGSVRASLLYDKDDLSVLVTADRSTFTQHVAFKDVTGGLNLFGDEDNYSVNAASVQDRELGGIAANIEYQLSESLSLVSITSYRFSESNEVYDSDGTAAEAFRVEPKETSDQVSQEFRLASNNDGPFNWIAGLYYFFEDSEWDTPVAPFGAVTLFTTNETNSYAAFFDGNYQLTDALKVSGGLRFSSESKDFTFTAGPSAAPLPPATDDDDTWDAVTPRLTVDYQLDDNSFLYSSISRGFKSGGFNLTDIGKFDPEFLWSYEAGFKGSFLDDRMRTNVSVFFYDYDDLQVRIPVQDGQVKTLNAATAEVKGVEVEFTGLLTDNLKLNGSLSYLDAEYTEYKEEFFDTVPGSPTEGEVIAVNDFAGNQLNRAPEWKFNLNAEYSHALHNGGSLDLRLEYAYESEMFFTAQNDPDYGREETNLFNLRLIWNMNDNFASTLYVENLGDERYVANAVPISGLPKGYVSAPRMFGVKFSYRH